jgi:hypothetical protein
MAKQMSLRHIRTRENFNSESPPQYNQPRYQGYIESLGMKSLEQAMEQGLEYEALGRETLGWQITSPSGLIDSTEAP